MHRYPKKNMMDAFEVFNSVHWILGFLRVYVRFLVGEK